MTSSLYDAVLTCPPKGWLPGTSPKEVLDAQGDLGSSRQPARLHARVWLFFVDGPRGFCKQCLHPRVAEAQRRGALTVDVRRTVEIVEHVGSDGAVVAEGFDAQQASVGGKADLFQIIKVLQPAADREVVRVVDHRLGAQRAPLLVVLLDARVLVVHMQRRDDPRR